MVKNCSGEILPVFVTGKVSRVNEAEGAVPAGSVFNLLLCVGSCKSKRAQKPLPGQFYLLRSVKSSALLGRPVSVYHSELSEKDDELKIEFLILKKGKGTEELCSLNQNDDVELIGPLGNYWPQAENEAKIAVIGGGVGVAPVAGFASTLQPETYDFYAAFKSGSYGLEYVKAKNLIITTDDGSAGIKGMITAAIDEKSVKQYDVVYACGPAPMLSYIKKICEEAGVQCYLSLEKHMACGLGACLGCTVKTTEGNKRCCKDGPVFDSRILDFSVTPSAVTSPLPRWEPLQKGETLDLSVNVAGVQFKNPLIAASGTFGYGLEYSSVFDVSSLGGICSKGLTLEARPGNPGERLVETPSGLINSIGLENPGIEHFIENELPSMMKLGTTAIANLSGSSIETYVKGALLLDKTDVPMIELNISCPNVKAGGMAFGMEPDTASIVTRAVREATKKPLMVKLSPNAPDLTGVALAVLEAGADAISLVNTFQATSINIETGRPVFENIHAGFSGPAVKPIALRMVYDVCKAIRKRPQEEWIPVVGLGGISKWQDVVEFIMAGAHAVEVGTITFSNPFAMKEMISGLSDFMARKGYKSLSDFRGSAQCK